MNQAHTIEIVSALATDIATRADAADKAGRLPAADVTALRQSGYLSLTVPQEFGGYGLSLLDALRAHTILAQGSAATALVAGMQLQVFGHAREVGEWSAAHMEQFATAVVQDGALFNSIASEPLLGSPSRGGAFESAAVADGADWRLTGHKTWSTGGTHLTHMLVRCMVGDKPGVVLVHQGAPGVRWEETWSEALSMRASDSDDVYFDNVLIPAADVVAIGGTKGKVPNIWFPMMMSAIYLGTSIAARNQLIAYALERIPTALGKPIATLPKIQRQIGEMDVAIQGAQALLFAIAGHWRGDESEGQRAAFTAAVAAAKTAVTTAANEVTDKALQVAGGISITKALPLERYFRDVRAGMMQPPSGDAALELVGRAAIDRYQPIPGLLTTGG